MKLFFLHKLKKYNTSMYTLEIVTCSQVFKRNAGDG